ncbi:unnamed protein product [Prunus armeniaca]|uniref:Eukaryotic translation initiation factor 3 subunit H n=1 Tax=Prunus armeniaca TaxID=36596 RepID=A0A6J5TJA8_PRUAR|nr:unnamed protein product [Prunus armeniaca]
MATPVARSFLQVAATEEVASPLRVVQIEGLVILKIIKHCKEFSPALVTGQLLGLDVGSVLEVTNCFPFPIREEDEEIEADGANYQLEMMRCLREVNVDNNTVGWYQSTLLGSFQTVELIETFMNYQLIESGQAIGMYGKRKVPWLHQVKDLSSKVVNAIKSTFVCLSPEKLDSLKITTSAHESSLKFRKRAVQGIGNKGDGGVKEAISYSRVKNIRRCVCIIYDPLKSNQGVLALKALKLSDSFMELYRTNNFTGEKLREKNLSWVDIFEEIPIKVSNSALISAFMTELEADTPVVQCDYDRLQLSTSPFLERNMEFLIECMYDLSMEQQKFQYYYRNLSRQQGQQQAWLQKRRAENMARKATGEEPLPEEDPSNPVFKPLPEPSRLDSFLITNQISNYCNQINGVAGQSFSRLYLTKALHEN